MANNLSYAARLMKGADYQTALSTLNLFSMGLQEQLDLQDPIICSVFKPKTTIYRMLSRETNMIKQRAFSSPSVVMDEFRKMSINSVLI